MLLVLLAQMWLDSVPDALEILVWSCLGTTAIIVCARTIWGVGPVAWVRDNIAEDIEKRVKRVSDDQAAEQYKRVEELVDTKVGALDAKLDEALALARATEGDLKQHMIDSANQHRAEVDERAARQRERDDRDVAIDDLIAGVLTRLRALEPQE